MPFGRNIAHLLLYLQIQSTMDWKYLEKITCVLNMPSVSSCHYSLNEP